MTSAPILVALLRRKAFFALTAILCFGAVVALTLSLPQQYDATVTLFVGEAKSGDESLAVDTNVGEQLSRTFSTLAAQPGVADAVRARINPPPSRSELFARMTFTPVERTQLLQMTARGSTPQEAATIANRYAETFAERVADDFVRGDAPTRVTVAEPAVVPTSASAPNVPLYLGFGLALALLLAAGAALLRDRLDDRLHVGLDDLAVLGHPVLARIPEFNARGTDDPTAADAFRLLRANIDFSSDIRPRVVGVTSAAPLDGKSTVAAQLAIAAAASGERVVLVEADLRRPGIRNGALAQGWEPGELGLTHYLWGSADMESVLAQHPLMQTLWVLWAGAPVPNPTRLLGSERLDELLEELRVQFDRVIVDTSPISVGADASIVLARLDGTLFVVNAGRTSRSGAHAGIAQLETSRATLLGVVVNRDEHVGGRNYGYYAKAAAAAPKEDAPAMPDGVRREAPRRRLLR